MRTGAIFFRFIFCVSIFLILVSGSWFKVGGRIIDVLNKRFQESFAYLH
jgi:hypothetical protein